MVELGPESNDDLRRMFNDLYNGMMDNRERQRSPVCLWQNCTEPTVYEDVEELYRHSKTHIENIDTSQVAPIDRRYECRWRGCTKNYSKLKLLENHLREHTGNMNDGFLEILLCDQAKAIATECRQMRWHPAVIRWCPAVIRIFQSIFYHIFYLDSRFGDFVTRVNFLIFLNWDENFFLTIYQNLLSWFCSTDEGLRASCGLDESL